MKTIWPGLKKVLATATTIRGLLEVGENERCVQPNPCNGRMEECITPSERIMNSLVIFKIVLPKILPPMLGLKEYDEFSFSKIDAEISHIREWRGFCAVVAL